MTPDEIQEERKKVYATTRQDLLTRNLSNSEKYDNAILTLSTGLLGLSLAFIKNILPLDKSQCVCLLKLSWWLFGTSIVFTLISFVLSQLAIKRQLQYAKEYYLEGKEESFNKKNLPALLTEYSNYASGAFFIAGIVATVWFVSVNIKEGDFMAKKTGVSKVLDVQKIETTTAKGTVKKGATIPEMQPVGGAGTSQQGSVSQGSGSSGSAGKKKE